VKALTWGARIVQQRNKSSRRDFRICRSSTT
jgi:hypothetical protein